MLARDGFLRVGHELGPRGLVELGIYEVLVNREMKETLGGAAIQVAEGLVISLHQIGDGTPEPTKS